MSLLSFPYRRIPLLKKFPPWLPAGEKFKPLVRIKVSGWEPPFGDAVLDTGADETTFPRDLAKALHLFVTESASLIRRGRSFRFGRGDLELRLPDEGLVQWIWRTPVRFSTSPKYPLLGLKGFFQYVDATFLGKARRVDLRTNETFPGQVMTDARATANQPASRQETVMPYRLRFTYQQDLQQPSRLLPLVPLNLIGTTSSMSIEHALVDTGAEVCLFPLSYANRIGVEFLDNGQETLAWGGDEDKPVRKPVRYGKVNIGLRDGISAWGWEAGVAFLDADAEDQPRFPLLGHVGFLEFMDATFLGAGQELKLETDVSFPGTTAADQ